MVTVRIMLPTFDSFDSQAFMTMFSLSWEDYDHNLYYMTGIFSYKSHFMKYNIYLQSSTCKTVILGLLHLKCTMGWLEDDTNCPQNKTSFFLAVGMN